MRKTPGGRIQHPLPPSSRAHDLRREAPACEAFEAGAPRCWACVAETRRVRCSSRPAGDLANAMGCPGRQDLRGSSPALLSYGCFAAERHDAKMRFDVRFGVSSPHGQPDRPAPLRPVRGHPGPRPRRRGRTRARRLRALRARAFWLGGAGGHRVSRRWCRRGLRSARVCARSSCAAE